MCSVLCLCVVILAGCSFRVLNAGPEISLSFCLSLLWPIALSDGLEIRVSVCMHARLFVSETCACQCGFFMSPRLLGQMGMHAAFKWQDVLERFFFLAQMIKLLLMYIFCYNEFIFSLNYICHVKEPQFNYRNASCGIDREEIIDMVYSAKQMGPYCMS